MAGKEFIELDDMEEARDKVRWGRARKSRVVDEQEKKATAYHEAGHAVVQYLEKDADPIHKVTIIPRGMALGVTVYLPDDLKQRLGAASRASGESEALIIRKRWPLTVPGACG